MKITPSLVMTVFIFVIAAAALAMSLNMGFRSRLFPQIILIPTLLITVLQLVIELRQAHRAAQRPKEPRAAAEHDEAAALERKRTLAAMGWLAAVLVAVWLFGFIPSVTLFVFAYILVEARRGIMLSTASALGMGAFLYLFMDRQLHLIMPEGLVRTWLGL